ncbi:MAG: glycosyltransferase [Pseudoalteromonas sp.]
MHIVFVLENFALGGVERVTEQLIIGLKSIHNCQVSLICEETDGELLPRYQTLGKIHSLDGRNQLLEFKKIIKDIKPDLVVFTKGGLSKFALFTPFNIKKVAIQHVPINLPENNAFRNIVRRLGAILLYRRLDQVVCVSKGILANLIELNVVNENKAQCIYNPVLDNSILSLANEQVEYQNYYVCVGRLHYQKGYDLLVDVIKLVKLKISDITVVILGDGPDHQVLLELIEKYDLANNIILHGVTDNPYKYIKHAKGILLPSRWEGLPTVLVEAAFLKTPIVAFDCRYGPKELTDNGQSGYLINFSDINAFAQNIISLEKNDSTIPSPKVDDFFLSSATAYYYKLFKSIL